MRKLKIFVCGSDEPYLQMLVRYVNTSEFHHKLAMQSFTQMDLFEQACAAGEKADLYLFEGMDQPDFGANNDFAVKVELIDNEHEHRYKEQARYVLKYQSLQRLLSQLMEICFEAREELNTGSERRGTKLISVYSATGGSGKTTVALNLAKQFAVRGLQTLYVNMELNQAACKLLSCHDENDGMKLLYYLKADKSKLNSVIGQFIRRHPQHKFDFLVPPKFMDEWLELSDSEVEELLKGLIGHAQYDAVILDIDSSFRSAFAAAFPLSRQIVWLVTDHLQCREKNLKVLQSLQRQWKEKFESKVMSNCWFVMNKRVEAFVSTSKQWTDGYELAYELPYEPAWKVMNKGEQLFASELFNKSLAGLSDKLAKMLWGVVNGSTVSDVQAAN